MSKYFAVFLPIYAVIISTILIILFQNKSSKRVSKKTRYILLVIGISIFIIGLIIYGIYK